MAQVVGAAQLYRYLFKVKVVSVHLVLDEHVMYGGIALRVIWAQALLCLDDTGVLQEVGQSEAASMLTIAGRSISRDVELIRNVRSFGSTRA